MIDEINKETEDDSIKRLAGLPNIDHELDVVPYKFCYDENSPTFDKTIFNYCENHTKSWYYET